MPNFFVKAYGCKLNKADAFLVENILSKKYNKVSSESEADFVVVQSCGVIEATEQRILKLVYELKKAKKIVVMTGCLPLISTNKKLFSLLDGVFVSRDFSKLLDFLKEVLNGQKLFYKQKSAFDKAGCLLRILDRTQVNFENSVSFVVPIAEGCLGRCSFCASRLARGKLQSFKKEYILQSIKKLVSLGAKEIQLTAQDIAQYGFDTGKRNALPELLKEINKIKGNFRVRLGMANPAFLKLYFDNFLREFTSERFYKFLHLPLQSGSDSVLRAMNRGYTVDEFIGLAVKFKEKFPFSMLSTDIIVGFPSETEKDFRRTVSVIKKLQPSILNITKYSPRPHTPASLLKNLPFYVKKERAKILEDLSVFLRNKEHRSLIGSDLRVLVVEKKRANSFLSRASSFKAVVINGKNIQLGDEVVVKIKNYRVNYLLGRVL